MKLTSKEARKILENARSKAESTGWIDHSICVGNAAGKIAKALSENGINVDIDKTITLGYIHDIGKRFDKHGGVLIHAMNGYKYIKDLGYDDEYAGICLKHSFLNNDIDCLANDRDETDKCNLDYSFVKEYIDTKYSIEEKIINLCDLICTTEVLTVEKRMIDLLLRHGVFKKTHYHIIETIKLKEYFDNLLGYNLYDLFPEIKDNL